MAKNYLAHFYPNVFLGIPYIDSLYYSLREDKLTLNCYSVYSPPTHVTWEKNGHRITFGDDSSKYHFSQIIYSRNSSGYRNILSVSFTSVEDVEGNYSCCVGNSIGSSNKLKTESVIGSQAFLA